MSWNSGVWNPSLYTRPGGVYPKYRSPPSGVDPQVETNSNIDYFNSNTVANNLNIAPVTKEALPWTCELIYDPRRRRRQSQQTCADVYWGVFIVVMLTSSRYLPSWTDIDKLLAHWFIHVAGLHVRRFHFNECCKKITCPTFNSGICVSYSRYHKAKYIVQL